MPAFRYVVEDVFAATPLEGNGVAVFTDARELADNAFDRDPQVRWPRIW
jgi:predicted PhzF superfamily epimerase YddE/YHI9